MREAVRKTVPAQIKTHFSFRSCAKRETVLGLQREKGANASISVRVGPCTRGYPGFLLSNTNRMASRIVFRGKARCRSRRCLLPRQRQAKRLRAELVLPVYSTIVPRFVPCPTIAMTSPVTVHRFIASAPFSSGSTLPHLLFTGLLRDGPQKARLRRFRAAFFCPRQRRPAIPGADRLLFGKTKRRWAAHCAGTVL